MTQISVPPAVEKREKSQMKGKRQEKNCETRVDLLTDGDVENVDVLD